MALKILKDSFVHVVHSLQHFLPNKYLRIILNMYYILYQDLGKCKASAEVEANSQN